MRHSITINNLTFGYGTTPLLRNLSLVVQKGEIVTLIGASGSGKTTILKLLSGLLPAPQETVAVFGDVAIMMQQDLLLPWRTVLGNVTIAAEMGHHPDDSLLADARDLLHDLELDHCLDLYPEELSGGMRQRVSLARALLLRRPILLLDEPFASLDVLLREQLYVLLRKLRDRYNLTILLVTHDFRDALVLSDRILLLADGGICQEWSIPTEHHRCPDSLAVWQRQLRDALQGQKKIS